MPVVEDAGAVVCPPAPPIPVPVVTASPGVPVDEVLSLPALQPHQVIAADASTAATIEALDVSFMLIPVLDQLLETTTSSM
jgi:hypothetical protein